MTNELDQTIKDEYKRLFESLIEVELYFSYTDIKKRPTNEKVEYLLNLIVDIASKNFSVKKSTAKRKGNFDKWLSFWKNWQAELTMFEIKSIIDNIELRKSYEDYLPKTKWNDKSVKS